MTSQYMVVVVPHKKLLACPKQAITISSRLYWLYVIFQSIICSVVCYCILNNFNLINESFCMTLKPLYKIPRKVIYCQTIKLLWVFPPGRGEFRSCVADLAATTHTHKTYKMECSSQCFFFFSMDNRWRIRILSWQEKYHSCNPQIIMR